MTIPLLKNSVIGLAAGAFLSWCGSVSGQENPEPEELGKDLFPNVEDIDPEAVAEAASETADRFDTSQLLPLLELFEDGLVLNSPDCKTTVSPDLDVLTFDGQGKGVEITYQGVTMQAGKIIFHKTSKDVFLEDKVRIFREELVFQGEKAVYNLETKKIKATTFRSSHDPLLFEAENFHATVPETGDFGVLEAEDTLFTTHDNHKPNFYIKADRMRIYPEEERVEMQNIRFYAADRAFLWLPFWSQNLDEELGWYFQPGFRSHWGAAFLAQYGLLWEDHSLVKLQLDLRSRRGAGFGLGLESQAYRDNLNLTGFQAWFLNDLNPDLRVGQSSEIDVNEDRYRLNLQHRMPFYEVDDTKLRLDFDVNRLSDSFVYEDFFPSEFKTEPHPDNVVKIVGEHPRGTATLWTRFRLNDFSRVDERAPELALDLVRQPIFDTGLFYEGETTLGSYRERLSDYEKELLDGGKITFEEVFGIEESALNPLQVDSLLDDFRDRIDGYSYNRFDTYHQLVYPGQLFGWLNVVPRAGLRYTHYFNVDGGGEDDFSDSRSLFHAGLETSFKLSKVYGDVKVPAWGIDQVRHIVQPFANYSYLQADSLPGEIPRIDRLIPTTRLRPISVSQFVGVDDLRSWNVLRVGMRNTLQTKRNGETHNWLTLNSYVESYFQDPEFDREFSNIFNELVWSPVPWINLEVDAQLPILNNEQDFLEVNSRVRFMPYRNMEVAVGHRYLNNHPFFGDSNLVNLQLYTRISENWGVGVRHRYELDDGTLELQQYSLHRDLSSWTAAIGGIIRNHRNNEREYGLLLSFTLKAMPRLSVPLSVDPNPNSGE